MQKGGSTIVPNDGSNSNGAGGASPQETKWMSKRTSLAPRRDSGTVIYSQFKQQIHLKVPDRSHLQPERSSKCVLVHASMTGSGDHGEGEEHREAP